MSRNGHPNQNLSPTAEKGVVAIEIIIREVRP